MNIFLPFIFGFFAAAIGILPPGLINMTAAKIDITDGRKNSMMFVLGAIVIIILQAYISVICARYINNHQEVVVLLREIGLAIFIGLSIYFLFIAKKLKLKKHNSKQIKSKKNRFFLGILISTFNFFPIPYYVFISITLASYKLFAFTSLSILSLVFGVMLGSFSVFYLYVVFFNKTQYKSSFLLQNINTILGLITTLVALLTLLNIIKYYYFGT